MPKSKPTVSRATKAWIRNVPDEKAVDEYEINEMQGMYFVWWLENYCRLWEGSTDRFRLVSYWPEEPDWWSEEFQPPQRTIINEFGFVERYHWFILRPPRKSDYEDDRQFKRDQATYKQSQRWTRKRIDWHLHRVKRGLHVDWQFECMFRSYAWVQREADPEAGYSLRRFTKGNYWVAKKNKKSPTQAVKCIYDCAGDGEPGNNVYPAASDGGQAKRIVGKHINKTIKNSPILKHVFRLETQSLKAEFLCNDSSIEPLSSNNVRSQKSKEGLNGDVSVDEYHVVDRDFIGRVDRAGISRDEPWFSSFSTAGDEPDCIGRDEWDAGERNNRGEDPRNIDLRRIHCSYHVPLRVEIREVVKDFEKYARMSNPALGHTVKLRELKADMMAKKRSRRERAGLLRYRFNQWQHGSADFIAIADWDKCKRSYVVEAIADCGGGIGLDISLTDDLTSCVFAVDPSQRLIDKLKIKIAKSKTSQQSQSEYQFEETIRLRAAVLWSITWITQYKLELLAEEKPEILDWAEAGHLRIMDGRTVDRDRLLLEFREIAKLVRSQALSLDVRYAFELGDSISKFTNIEVHEFPQSFDHYALPTEHFERLVLQGALIHPGNPMCRWQIGNTKVKEVAGKTKPMKPSKHSNAKIDFTQAGIMSIDALSRAAKRPDNRVFGVVGA